MKRLIPLFIIAIIATTAVAEEKKSAAKADPEASIRAMEERWEASIQKHDAKTIGDMIAPDFAGVGEGNKFMDKSSLLDRTKKDTDTYTSTSLKNTKVRLYGPNAGVAIGDAVESGTGKDGKAFHRTFRYTDTWVNRNGQWQCVAEQVTLIAGTPVKQ
jgi:ketosteroid isomerase-like protein